MSYYESCKKCDARFGSEADLETHVKAEHAPASRPEPPDGHATWLDSCLDYDHDSGAPAFARAELSELRQRVTDLELMLRAMMTEDWPRMLPSVKAFVKVVTPERDVIYLDDDGTGLPALTPAARRALTGEKE